MGLSMPFPTCIHFLNERYLSFITIAVASQWSLLENSLGMTSKLSFIVMIALPKSLTVWALTFLVKLKDDDCPDGNVYDGNFTTGVTRNGRQRVNSG